MGIVLFIMNRQLNDKKIFQKNIYTFKNINLKKKNDGLK